ncbi:unnamed protein product, partial [Amoebophrya sp. A25]|eukprot:GSA25T00007570001.1
MRDAPRPPSGPSGGPVRTLAGFFAFLGDTCGRDELEQAVGLSTVKRTLLAEFGLGDREVADALSAVPAPGGLIQTAEVVQQLQARGYQPAGADAGGIQQHGSSDMNMMRGTAAREN